MRWCGLAALRSTIVLMLTLRARRYLLPLFVATTLACAALISAQIVTQPTIASSVTPRPAQITLSAAQINTMFTTPVLMIPAQGPGTLIAPVKCVFNAIFGSAAFTGGGNIFLFFGPSNLAVNEATSSITTTFLTSFISNQIAIPNTTTVTTTSGINTGLYVANMTGVFAGGTGSSMTVNCSYNVLTGMQ